MKLMFIILYYWIKKTRLRYCRVRARIFFLSLYSKMFGIVFKRVCLKCLILTRGKVYSSCVRSVILHAADTWAMKVDTLNRLRRNDRAMIRWICNVRAKDEVSSDSLLTKLGIQDLDLELRTSRMRWFGHVKRSTGWIAEVRKLNVVAQKRSGRPRKSWDEVLENDRKKLGMDSADPQNGSEWRGRLRERLVKKPNLR